MAIHDTIRKLRQQNQWTQEKTAELLEMSKNGYAKMERGECGITVERLQKLSQVFQVNILELLNGTDKSVVLFVNEKFENSEQCVNYYNYSQAETEKLKLQLAHSQTLLEQKENEIAALKEIIALLKNQNPL